MYGTARHPGTGRDAHAITLVQFIRVRLPSESHANRPVTSAGFCADAISVQGVAVHRRIVLPRHIDLGRNVLGNHPAEQLLQRKIFVTCEWRGCSEHSFARPGDGNEIRLSIVQTARIRRRLLVHALEFCAENRRGSSARRLRFSHRGGRAIREREPRMFAIAGKSPENVLLEVPWAGRNELTTRGDRL